MRIFSFLHPLHRRRFRGRAAALSLIYLFSFFWSLAIALPLYIQSSYLEQFVAVDAVGLYVTAATAITLVAILFFPRLITRFGNYPVALVLVTVLAASSFLLSQGGNPWWVLVSFVVHYLAWNLIVITNDVFLEHVSDADHAGRIRTTFLTVFNLGIMFAPLLMGYISEGERYNLVYAVSGVLLVPALFLLMAQKQYVRGKQEYHSRSLPELLAVFRGNRNLFKVFHVAFALRLFYSIMVLYSPIYLHRYVGFDWETIGIMFTVMLLPFVLFELPAGSLADRYWGEKEMMVIGLILMIGCVGAIPFMTSADPVVWTVLLFMSRVGAALVEAMQDVYFFKIVSRRDMDVINLFRDIGPAAWLAGSLGASVLLQFIALPALFLVVAFVLFVSLRPALMLVDTK